MVCVTFLELFDRILGGGKHLGKSVIKAKFRNTNKTKDAENDQGISAKKVKYKYET